jgi:FKBP-type peptidyl-prolyl cis-trans isomerase
MQLAIYAYLLFLSFFPLFGSEAIKAYLQTLSQQERILLDDFLRKIVTSPNGFVLYGDKPMALYSYYYWTGCEPDASEDDVSLIKGKELFQGLNIAPYNKEHTLLIFNSSNYCNFVCINRKAFIKTVDENISLFRYVLGPLLTSESLLQELIDAKDDFYAVLKDDNVLLGILFGYGTQNALLVSRQESICYDCVDDREEEFPFISWRTKINSSSLPKGKTKRPSLGFSTLIEEANAIVSQLSYSHHDRPIDPCQIPFFGCVADSKETQELLATYKANQSEIIKALKQQNFLEKTMLKFCATTSGTIEIPTLPKRQLCLPTNKEELAKKTAEIVRVKVHLREDYCRESLMKAYLQGVVEREESKQRTSCVSKKVDGYQLKKQLIDSEKLDRANAYFKRLSQDKKAICLIPNGVYYKTLKEGRGPHSSSKMKSASFYYSYKFAGEKRAADIGMVKEENLDMLIPGIAHALIGMKQGEERSIFIHPRYAYGLDVCRPPHAVLVANVRLIDFEEGEQETAIQPPFQIEAGNFQELLAQWEQFKAAEYHEEGKRFWDTVKKTGDPIDFQAFKKSMNEVASATEDSFGSIENARQFGIDLKYYLLSLQNSHSRKTPDRVARLKQRK